MKTVTLKGRHPYIGGEVFLDLPAHDTLPGHRITDRHNSRQGARENAWVGLAGPYMPEKQPADANYLLSLVWDLKGLPIIPDGKARPAANFVLLEEAGGLMVYRAAAEMIAEDRMSEFTSAPNSLNVAHERKIGREAAR